MVKKELEMVKKELANMRLSKEAADAKESSAKEPSNKEVFKCVMCGKQYKYKGWLRKECRYNVSVGHVGRLKCKKCEPDLFI